MTNRRLIRADMKGCQVKYWIVVEWRLEMSRYVYSTSGIQWQLGVFCYLLRSLQVFRRSVGKHSQLWTGSIEAGKGHIPGELRCSRWLCWTQYHSFWQPVVAAKIHQESNNTSRDYVGKDEEYECLTYTGVFYLKIYTTQHNTTQHNTTQHNTTQHNTTQHNTTQHNTTQHNTTQHNTTQHNTTWTMSNITKYFGQTMHKLIMCELFSWMKSRVPGPIMRIPHNLACDANFIVLL